MAHAILRGEQEKSAVADRLRHVLGRNWPWIEPLCVRYNERFAGHIRPRLREVVRFLHDDHGFVLACKKHGHVLKIKRWIFGAQPMLPVPAARGWDIPPIETLGTLAEMLRVTPTELGWFADLKGLGYKRPQPRLAHYHYQALTKSSGGFRLVESPKAHLKEIQRQVLSSILNHVPAHAAAHGFVKGRSIHTFAAPHVGQRVVLRMDLENFFPSFSGARVQSFFRTMGYPEPVADLLGGLATNCVPQRTWRDLIKQSGVAIDPEDFWHVRQLYARPHLPQGAPTSPALANLCCYRLDCRLSGLAEKGGARYTRYADDLAFSGDDRFERSVEPFARRVAAILKEEGFSVQHRKTRIMRQSVRQHLAGLVTNQRLNVRRSDFDLLKAILTNCVRHGPASQNREAHPEFCQHLQGRISFIESTHAERGKRLRAIFDRIDWA